MTGVGGGAGQGQGNDPGPVSPVGSTLDTAYNHRLAVPDHTAILAHWREASVAARTRPDIPRRLDLAYGQGSREVLDLFGFGFGVPTRPLLIFLHGGAWQGLDKTVFSFLAPPFVEAGAAVAILNFPLCPDVPFEAISEAVRKAVRVLWHQASSLGLNRHHFMLAGHSSGAHLVAELLCTRWSKVDGGMPVDCLRGGIAISGMFDLEPLVGTKLNVALGLTEASARHNSPVLRDPVPGASLTLAVGALEHSVVHDQSARLARAWAAMGAHETWIPLPGRNHLSALEALAEPDHPVFHDALARLGLFPALPEA